MSPVLAGKFLATRPPRKSQFYFFYFFLHSTIDILSMIDESGELKSPQVSFIVEWFLPSVFINICLIYSGALFGAYILIIVLQWWRCLVGYSPWGREESDTTEQLHFHFSLSCIGEGNGNPLQCSCLENPRDRGAWWAAVYGVAQSWTWLMQLSSSSSSLMNQPFYHCYIVPLCLNSFYLKSIFSDISVVTLALFWLPFAWNIFFYPFT